MKSRSSCFSFSSRLFCFEPFCSGQIPRRASNRLSDSAKNSATAATAGPHLGVYVLREDVFHFLLSDGCHSSGRERRQESPAEEPAAAGFSHRAQDPVQTWTAWTPAARLGDPNGPRLPSPRSPQPRWLHLTRVAEAGVREPGNEKSKGKQVRRWPLDFMICLFMAKKSSVELKQSVGRSGPN